MINLLEQIRAALDELEPRLEGRVVDIEMPRLFVVADADALRRTLVALIGRTVEQCEGNITVRTTKQGTGARIEVSGEPHPLGHAAADWSVDVARDVDAIGGAIGEADALVWMTVPLSGGNAPE